MTLWTPILGLAGMGFAFIIYGDVVRQPAGSARMQEIALAIHDGAMTYLRRQYTILIIFIVVVAALLAAFLDRITATAFVSGAICSVLAGFFGMQAATKANVRTAEAARTTGQDRALLTAFHGGAVMGVAVASLGLIGVGAFPLLYGNPKPPR